MRVITSGASIWLSDGPQLHWSFGFIGRDTRTGSRVDEAAGSCCALGSAYFSVSYRWDSIGPGFTLIADLVGALFRSSSTVLIVRASSETLLVSGSLED